MSDKLRSYVRNSIPQGLLLFLFMINKSLTAITGVTMVMEHQYIAIALLSIKAAIEYLQETYNEPVGKQKATNE